MRYIFLTEEESMKAFLDTLFGLNNPGFEWTAIAHRGKSDLVRHGISAAFRKYADVDAAFVVLIDQDAKDCLALKDAVAEQCRAVCSKLRRSAPFKVRIVCNELESWYFGDLSAIDKAFGTALLKNAGKERFRNPEKLGKEDLRRYIGGKAGQQIRTAEKIAGAMTKESVSRNRSRSFQVFLKTLAYR